ncbi:MAG: MotA/TolQ/ExbB proton channel family protein [Opitutae bacterium]|jgi:biopolymer transport protein ExbB|nr:MotA/TolQ/ExbB proton channel family protein [Opitutae bacterium]MBT4665239.1 MotA/TolQ/ExbB proton channel family protein [Opitutae bacterium]MBT5908245.1 MotA/TolQ/ExbB proton channel family protein [Opitutae bacterium]MBT6852542.1 MotA/TolQ/ExbB proton channel family protein [Opitutae bacterium]MBT7742000.1 MotA/TolQ/ExbB proton channel family protein [Opitutae bacterium]
MLEHLLKGGPIMVPLILCSLISLAVVYDRWSAFRANRKIDTRSLRSRVLASLRKDDYNDAISVCETSSGPIASVLLSGVRSYKHLKEKDESSETMRLVVGQTMEESGAQAMSVVTKRLDVLTTIGTAAPLLGMTGTVTGMIASFAGLAEAGSIGGSGGEVANGISEAMVTTAVGLIIALAAVIPQSVFNRWSDEIELEMDEGTSELTEFILTHH